MVYKLFTLLVKVYPLKFISAPTIKVESTLCTITISITSKNILVYI